ncbi:MAG: family 16 glycosylhydrolase [Paludibacteraceae bacterium]|nr:family 16 glycosylhydrolase [Paludibacteraceae bacterium]
MNLFTARLTGKMVSADTFESNIRDLQERIQRYRAVEKSPELQEYLELKKEVETTDFQNNKSELKTRKYADTEEGRKTNRLNKLNGTLRMRAYKKALEMPVFQAFLEFRDSDDFAKMSSFKERLKSSELRMYNMIYRSAFYKNYLKVLNSDELQQLTALEQEAATEDFQKRNAFWADEKRWEHSENYQKEKRYLQLANSDDIKFYFKQREEEIDWSELFRPSFDDNMSSSKNWKPGYGYINPAMKDGFSHTNERQAYNGGKNAFFADGRMDIETHAEPKRAVAWDEKKGFVEHLFEYTSDVMNTRDAFAQESGMFMAKVRSQGTGHHFFGLSTGKVNEPMLALYHYNGKVHQMGYINGKNSKLADLSGMLRSMYHVYTIRWTKNEIIFYVNNLEILRMRNSLPKEQMFFLAQSFLPANENGGEGKLKVQWVRAYRGVEDSELAQRNAAAAAAREKATAEAQAASGVKPAEKKIELPVEETLPAPAPKKKPAAKKAAPKA